MSDLQPGDFIFWKRHPQKDSTPLERPLQILLTNPCTILCHQTPRTDSWIHISPLKKAPKPDWTCTPTGVLKDFQELKHMTEKETAFPKWLNQAYTLFSCCCFLFRSLFFLGKTMILSIFLNLLQKGGTFLTAGSLTKNSNLFIMSEIPWSYL